MVYICIPNSSFWFLVSSELQKEIERKYEGKTDQ